MNQYERRLDPQGKPYLATPLSGYLLTRLPLLNKSSGFTLEERRELGLDGLIAPQVSSLEQQVARGYTNFKRFGTPLDRHVYLLIYRWPRGLVVSTDNIDRVDEIMAQAPVQDVRLSVATDSEGILGIGDQGFGGMAICIGKLSLYTAAAGIDPATTLPIELDVGTNRADLLDDPLYLGVRHERLVGQAYYDFVERFVTAFEKRFPHALLQWEDFSKQKAFDVLNSYRDRLPSFNDDVQGTGAVVLAGLLAAARKTRRPLSEETFVIHGAGAGGVGVARQVTLGLMKQGLSKAEARARVLVIDSRGLLVAGREGLESYKEEVAQDPSRLAGWEMAGAIPTLQETVANAKVTGLIGLSGQAGAFDQQVVAAVAGNSSRPIIFPLSNPTDNSEITPENAYAWTGGSAVVASGSPFPDVMVDGHRRVVGQGNNAFVFPGLGLGTMVVKASRLTDGMFTAAAESLGEYTDAGRLLEGAVYPSVNALRRASRHLALAVAKQALSDGVARREVDEDALEEAVDAAMWEPRYLPIRKAE